MWVIRNVVCDLLCVVVLLCDWIFHPSVIFSLLLFLSQWSRYVGCINPSDGLVSPSLLHFVGDFSARAANVSVSYFGLFCFVLCAWWRGGRCNFFSPSCLIRMLFCWVASSKYWHLGINMWSLQCIFKDICSFDQLHRELFSGVFWEYFIIWMFWNVRAANSELELLQRF